MQEELYPQSDEPVRPEADDARLLDLDVDEESPFLRAQKRVSVRRSTLPKKTASRLTWAGLALAVVGLFAVFSAAAYHYGKNSWRFRVSSSDDIEITGLGNVTRSQVMEVLGEDIGRNIFFVSLEQRRKQLEQIPWVESASVMRFVPNRLKVEIRERNPVAFARIGSRIELVDATGALMELPVGNKKKFSFPVIGGLSLAQAPALRAQDMKVYNQLIGELDSSGAHYSQNLSEVDLSDLDDVKVVASDPAGEVLVHLGSSDFLNRFKIYVSHVQEWRQQFSRLDSVDLRYEHQIVVNPDLAGPAKEPPLSMSATKAAMAAGVKPAALVIHELPHSVTPAALPVPASTKPAARAVPVRTRAKRGRHRKTALHKATIKTPISIAGETTKISQSGAPGPAPGSAKIGSPPPVASVAAKPGSKPSPAIPKGQAH